jgi:DivIVA domain-containing protein
MAERSARLRRRVDYRRRMSPLDPEEIPQAKFRRRLLGYDPRQVDAFLDRVAEDYAAALLRLAALEEREDG